jgi:hypothetical protein
VGADAVSKKAVWYFVISTEELVTVAEIHLLLEGKRSDFKY